MSQYIKSPSVFKRWLQFYSVGAIGIVVQIGTLTALISGCGTDYIPATILAVEAAILHNFIWHKHWTWADRRSSGFSSTLTRLLYFHLANGTISLFGNILLMGLFVEAFSMHYIPANGLCIAICSVLNFMAGDRIVFRARKIETNPGEWPMCPKHRRNASLILILFTGFVLCHIPAAESAELEPETVKAWESYIDLTEKRIERELKSDKNFLVLDFQDKDKVLLERKELLSGDIPIKAMDLEDDQKIKVPGGRIHHWRGGVFIPGADLDFVLSRVEDPESADMTQEDVLESKVLERFPGGLRLFLKLQRTKIVTVIYNTEHDVRFQRHSPVRASSSSVATRIAEVEKLDEDREREKPIGKDHGFLWRMNSYWRYEQTNKGVIVECETVTLSRSVPALLKYMIGPIINRIARESLERTLESMRVRLTRAMELKKNDAFTGTSVAIAQPTEKGRGLD